MREDRRPLLLRRRLPPGADRSAGVPAGLVGFVLATGFLVRGRVGGGWYWDAGNALGFVALAGLLGQMIALPGPRELRRHEWLGYAVLGLAIGHAFWFLLGDGAAWVYLVPGAPLYMWLGLGGLLGLAALTVLARMPERLRVHRRYRTFRRVHRWLGVAVVIAAALHVLLSGFYLPTWPQSALLAGAVLAACFGRSMLRRLPAVPVPSLGSYLVVAVVAVGVFTLARNLPPW